MIRLGALLSGLVIAFWVGITLSLRSEGNTGAIVSNVWIAAEAIIAVVLTWFVIGVILLVRAGSHRPPEDPFSGCSKKTER
jgi:hypothetical protein